jgi:hypothetical protein
MFTPRNQANFIKSTSSAHEWTIPYFDDTASAINLAIRNPEYLGWLQVLLGPKRDAEFTNSFYEIMYLESELHLSLVILNILIQTANEHFEELVFNLIRSKFENQASVNTIKIDEIEAVRQFYQDVRNKHLTGHENKLWFSLNDSNTLIESEQHAELYSESFHKANADKKSKYNRFASYRDLFTKYSEEINFDKAKPVNTNSKKLIQKIKKHFEFEQEQILLEFYNSWKSRISQHKYSDYNTEIAKYHSKQIDDQINTLLNTITFENEIDVTSLLKTVEKNIVSLIKRISHFDKAQQREKDKYLSHVRYWMSANKDLIPEKYRNILPEYFARQIITTEIQTIPQENILHPETGNSLLHIAVDFYQAEQDSETLNNITNVVMLLLNQGANALRKNNEGQIALDFSAEIFSEQLGWRLLRHQFDSVSFIDPLPRLISKELIKYISRNDSKLISVTHDATIKKTRLMNVLELYKLLCRARQENVDQELINLLLITRRNISGQSSALLDTIDDIIDQVKKSGLINFVKFYHPKKQTITKPTDGFQLYKSLYNNYRHNLNPHDQTRKYNDLYLACVGLVDAAISGNVKAKDKLVSEPKQLLSFDMSNLIDNEFYSRLKQLLLIHTDKIEIYRRMAQLGSKRLATQFYANYETRYHDIVKTLEYKQLSKNKNPESEQRNKALKILLHELSGTNPLLPVQHGTEFDSEPKLSHRLLARNFYQILVEATFKDASDSSNSINKYLYNFDDFIKDNITVINCNANRYGQYRFQLNAADIESAKTPIISFFDNDKSCEVARFEISKGKIEFRAYGDIIYLDIKGNLEYSYFLFRNEESAIYLTSDLSAKNIFIGVNAEEFVYSGNACITNSFDFETSGNFIVAANSKISANTTYLKANGLNIAGEINIDNTATLHVAKAMSVAPEGLLTAKELIHINALALTNIRGKILSKGNLAINVIDSIYINGNGTLAAAWTIKLLAKSLMCTDTSIIKADKNLICEVSQTAIFDKFATLSANSFIIQAAFIKNYSPNLIFDFADFNIKDTLTNHPTGVIKTKNLLKLRGESVWSSGRIEYGQMLSVTLNKVFVLGLAERKDVYEYFKNIRNKPERPCISGGNANIVSGIFINLFSGVWTKNLSITALAEINLLGVTCSTITTKSRILAIDAGISLPNLPAIVGDLTQFFDLVGNQQYKSAVESLLTKSAFFKASSLARWVTQTLFPQLGKPLNLIWGGASLALALPDLCIQIKNLYDQKFKHNTDIEPYQYYSLITTINSAVTQSASIESQCGIFQDGIGSIEFHAPSSIDTFVMDALAMALPSSNNISLINFDTGLQANFTIQHRDFMAFARYNAWLALNASRTFYALNDQDQMVLANNYSLSGNEASVSGNYYGFNFFAYVNDLSFAASISAREAFLQVDRLRMTNGSSADVKEFAAITKEADLEGKIKSDHVSITAEDTINETGSIEITPKSDALDKDNRPAIEERAHTINESGQLSAEGQTVALVSTGDTFLDGGIRAAHVEVIATDSITNQGSIVATSAPGVANDDDRPAIEESAHTINAGGLLSAEGQTVALVASSDAVLDGEIKSAHVEVIATDTITNKGTIETTKNPYDVPPVSDDKKTPNDIPATNEDKVKNDSPTPSDDKTNIDPATPPDDKKPDGPPPAIEEKAHTIVAGGEIKALDQTIVLLADEKLTQTADVTAGTLIDEAKVIFVSGISTVHQELLKAEESIEYAGVTHLTAISDTAGEADIEAPVLTSSAESKIDGDGNLFIEAKQQTLGSIDVNRLSDITDDIQDEIDFIYGRGQWAHVQYRDGLSLTSHNNFTPTEDLSLTKDLSLNCNVISLDHNIHSSKSLNLTTTGGGIYITKTSVTADEILSINSSSFLDNEASYLYGGEVYMHTQSDIINRAGIIGSSNYTEMKSDYGSIMNLCTEYNVQGKYDTVKHYDPGVIYGGAGVNHDGNGTVLVAGNKIIIDGSIVSSVGSNVLSGNNGIDLTEHHHSYIDYERHSKTWYGKKSTTIEYANQVQASTVYSANGSNTLTSMSGSIYSCAGEFLSNHDNNFYAKGDITLLGIQLEKKLYKDKSSWWGLSDHKTTQIDDVNVPTFVINPENTRMISWEQNVNIYDAYIQNAGTFEISGRDVTLLAPVLNHTTIDESRGFGINSPLLSMPNNISSLYNDYNALTNSQNGIEYTANTWKLDLDAMNSLNGIIGTIRGGSLAQSLFSSSYLTSVELTYSHTKTTMNSQTVANNVGVNVGNLKINATDTLLFEGLPISVLGLATINARCFKESGIALHSSYQTDTQSISAGFSLKGSPTFGASASESGGKSTYYYNQDFQVGGELTVNADHWEMDDANVVAGHLTATVGDLSIVSHANSSSSYSWSVSANTNGNFSASASNYHSAVIGTPSGISTRYGTDLTANTIYLEGAKIISEGTNNIIANSITSKSVEEYNHGYSFGFSGNINNFTNPKPGDWRQSIPAFNVNVGYQNYIAEQQATINNANLNVNNFHGDQLYTRGADGLKVLQNDHLDLRLEIPIYSKAGMAQLEDNLQWAKNKISSEIPGHLIETDDEPPPYYEDKDDDDDKPTHQKPTSGNKAPSPGSKSSTSWIDNKSSSYAKSVFSSPAAMFSTTTNDTSLPVIGDAPANKTEYSNSLQQYITPFSDDYSSTTTLLDEDDVDLEIPTIKPKGFASGTQKFEEEFVDSFDAPPPPPKSMLAQMNDSHIVNDIVIFGNAVTAPVVKTVSAVISAGNDVATIDVADKDSQEFKDANERMAERLAAAENIVKPVLSFANDVATMDVEDTNSQDFQDAAARMSERITAFENNSVVSFANDVAIMDVAPNDSQEFQDAYARMQIRYENEDQQTVAYQLGSLTGLAATFEYGGEFADMSAIGGEKVAEITSDVFATAGTKVTDYVLDSQSGLADYAFDQARLDPVIGSTLTEVMPENDIKWGEKLKSEAATDRIDEKGTGPSEYKETESSAFYDEFEEPPSPLPFRQLNSINSTSPFSTREIVPLEEIGDTTLPINDRLFPPNPSEPTFGNANALQSEFLNQHGMFRDRAAIPEPIKRVAGSDIQFTNLEEKSSNSYITDRLVEDTYAVKRHPGRSNKDGLPHVGSTNSSYDEGNGDNNKHGKHVEEIEIPEKIKSAKLPYKIGEFSYIPPKGWYPNMPLPRGPKNGPLDHEDNEWRTGGYRGFKDRKNKIKDDFEFDVYIEPTKRKKYEKILNGKKHINVSQDGMITHADGRKTKPQRGKKK